MDIIDKTLRSMARRYNVDPHNADDRGPQNMNGRIPSACDVINSVTNEQFRLRNWEKHRKDERHQNGDYPYCDAYAEYDGQRFTRKHVFEHFAQSDVKGVISAIKWGFPRGGRPGGKWQSFSDAFRRSSSYAEAIKEFRAAPARTPLAIVSKLNQITSGVGPATTTKIAYFALLKSRCSKWPDEMDCLIYDSMVRRAIKCKDYPDFADLRSELAASQGDISPSKQEKTYGLYLRSVHAAARRRQVQPAQIELFLFEIGRNLLPSKRGGKRSHASGKNCALY